jgi:hypothetical protein
MDWEHRTKEEASSSYKIEDGDVGNLHGDHYRLAATLVTSGESSF